MTVRCVMNINRQNYHRGKNSSCGLLKGLARLNVGLLLLTGGIHPRPIQHTHPAICGMWPAKCQQFIKLHNPSREKQAQQPAMIRRNSGERRPIGSNMSVDRPSPVPVPQAPLPPRRRRSSGASSRSSSSGVRTQQQQQQQALPPPPRRVAFKNETRVRIIHSWRDMSERQWRDTWVTVS